MLTYLLYHGSPYLYIFYLVYLQNIWRGVCGGCGEVVCEGVREVWRGCAGVVGGRQSAVGSRWSESSQNRTVESVGVLEMGHDVPLSL